MIVYGIISYLLLGGLIGGYFAVKKWGDKQQPVENQPGYSQFEDEQNGKKTIST